MRALLTTAALALFLSGCQNGPIPGPIRPDAQWLPWNLNKPQPNLDPASSCLSHSRLYQPTTAGKAIDTPTYTLITLEPQQAVRGAGELCIVDKVSGRLEITAVNDLQFLQTLQPPAPAR